jgi:hypothetical protein
MMLRRAERCCEHRFAIGRTPMSKKGSRRRVTPIRTYNLTNQDDPHHRFHLNLERRAIKSSQFRDGSNGRSAIERKRTTKICGYFICFIPLPLHHHRRCIYRVSHHRRSMA